MTDIQNLATSFFLEIAKREDEIFERAVRENAIPKITGKITKDKIRWRGIRMVQQNDLLFSVKWIEQRGKQISPKIITDYKININANNSI